jgi:uncharacterized membrane protein YdjX (TVP38/TMEM64 family)
MTRCCAAGLFLATSLTLGRKDNLHKVLLWVHSHRVAGFVIFCLLYVWFTVLFLPSALLAACAGAIYGFLPAIPLVSGVRVRVPRCMYPCICRRG